MAACSSASVHLASAPAAATGMTFGVPDGRTSIPASRYAPETSSAPEWLPGGLRSSAIPSTPRSAAE